MSLGQFNQQISNFSSEMAESQSCEGVVLLVEANQELRTVLAAVLAKHGYEVISVGAADEALRILTQQAPQIIVCDFDLPGVGGLEFKNEVQLHHEWFEIPFIFLASNTDRDEVITTRGLGVDDFLSKPFDPEELAAVIRGKLTLITHRRRMSGEKLEVYRRRIIHTLSHEFRTPLVSINTGTELLIDQMDELSKDQVYRLLESIQRGGQRLERLIHDFMLLQQIDLGHAQRTTERFRRRISPQCIFMSAIDGFFETVGSNFSKENLQTEIASGDLPLIDVYDVQVVSALQRLLSNAVKFGGSENPISLRLIMEGGRVAFSVRDRGPGIPKDEFVNLCVPFSQINREVTEQQGAGLGLTITRYLAAFNQGQVRFVSPTDGCGGLEVQLCFPAVA